MSACTTLKTACSPPVPPTHTTTLNAEFYLAYKSALPPYPPCPPSPATPLAPPSPLSPP